MCSNGLLISVIDTDRRGVLLPVRSSGCRRSGHPHRRRIVVYRQVHRVIQITRLGTLWLIPILFLFSSYIYAGSNGSTGDYDQGMPHPIAWYQATAPGAQPLNGSAPGPGRAFYTSLGHLSETWADPVFMGHVMGGLKWALNSGTTRWTNGTALVGQVQATEDASTGSSSVGATASSSGSVMTTSGTGTATSTSAADGTSTLAPANSGHKEGSSAGKTAAIAGAIVGVIGLML